MKEIYLTIGILQVLISVGVSIYLTLLCIQKHQYPNKIFSTTHGLSTIVMGILYIIAFTTLSEDKFTLLPENISLTSVTLLNQTRDPEYTNSFKNILEESDMKKFNSNESIREEEPSYHTLKEYFKKALRLPSKYVLQNYYSRRSRELDYTTGMNCEEILYLYIFSIYSFVHGMIYVLMHSVQIETILLRKSADKSTKTSLKNVCANEIPDNEKSMVYINTPLSRKNRYLIALMVFSMLFVPMICSGVVLIMMNDVQESISSDNILNATTLSNEDMDDIILNTNISLNTEVENVLNQIYNIMKDLNITQRTTTNTSYKFVHEKKIQHCRNEGTILRIYLFILFILGYILTIFYLRNFIKVHPMYLFNTKLTICFALSWFPAVAELIIRKYIMNTSPSVISEIMLLFGTFNQTIINILNTYAARKFIKNKNFIAPNMQNN